MYVLDLSRCRRREVESWMPVVVGSSTTRRWTEFDHMLLLMRRDEHVLYRRVYVLYCADIETEFA